MEILLLIFILGGSWEQNGTSYPHDGVECSIRNYVYVYDRKESGYYGDLYFFSFPAGKRVRFADSHRPERDQTPERRLWCEKRGNNNGGPNQCRPRSASGSTWKKSDCAGVSLA